MVKGTYTDFATALRQFESGIDEARFRSGDISADQIRAWIGDADLARLQSGELSWRDAQYKSTNFLGFVGYQFGEALMIDLGYYKDDIYYAGPGSPATNTWDGRWTGKNGITGLDGLKTSVQEAVILDEFAFNLGVIDNGLKAEGQSLAGVIGQTRTYGTAEGPLTVEFTLSGIMAASHLRGAYATLDLLLNGTQSADENGTPILKYLKEYGGYSTVGYAELTEARAEGTTLTLAETLWKMDFNGDGKIGTQGSATPGGPKFTDGGEEVFGGRKADSFAAKGGNDKVFGGAGNDRILGESGDDVLFGQSGNDTLDGGKGVDTLFGGAGNDVLRGGRGNDAFFFDAKLSPRTNVDRIADFRAADDYVGLDSDIFHGLGDGWLARSAFADIALRQADASDRILYDSGTGDLFFDRDGSGTRYAAIKFAHLDNHVALSAADFYVV